TDRRVPAPVAVKLAAVGVADLVAPTPAVLGRADDRGTHQPGVAHRAGEVLALAVVGLDAADGGQAEPVDVAAGGAVDDRGRALVGQQGRGRRVEHGAVVARGRADGRTDRGRHVGDLLRRPGRGRHVGGRVLEGRDLLLGGTGVGRGGGRGR